MTGVFNSRPSQPNYTFIWDVQVVLDYIKQNWADNISLSDKHLTWKVTILMALISASRAVQIHHLQVSNMARLQNQYKFEYSQLHKSWKRGKICPSLQFFAFVEDPEMCVVKCLDGYLLKSEPWRKNQETQLLLSFFKAT